MKKMTKIFLIMALVLLITGGLMTGAGLMAGASFETFATSTRENEFSSRCLRNLGRIPYLNNRWERWEEQQEMKLERWEDKMEDSSELEYDNGKQHHKGHHNNVEESKIFTADQVLDLSVEAERGEVIIKVVKGNEIAIANLCAGDTVEYEQVDKELYVSRSCKEEHKDPLMIEIPENNNFQELDLETISGSIAVYGKIQANETSVGVESGNVSIELLESRETGLECYHGNLSVTCIGKSSDYRIEAETENCNMELDEQHHRGKIQGIFGNRNSQSCIDIEGSAGNMKLSFENK